MFITAAVTPLVLSLEGYTDRFGEDDPEELTLMQVSDRERAQAMSEVLQDLFFLEYDAATPRDEEGLALEFPLVALQQLQEIAAAAEGYTVEEIQSGKAPLGVRYTQLINTNPEYGVYLPVAFEQSFFVEEMGVGSAIILAHDLDSLAPHLAARWPELVAEAPEWDVESLDPEEMGPVHVWQCLRVLCQNAGELNLPVQLG